jgi:hypothetical protein
LERKEERMPRYVIERTFAERFPVEPGTRGIAQICALVGRNADEAVTWLHSYVSDDRSKTFCVYEGPSPEAIRKAAALNRLPIDRITEVRVLDPYFY